MSLRSSAVSWRDAAAEILVEAAVLGRTGNLAKGGAKQLFVHVGPVRLGGVEERDTAVEGRPDKREAFLAGHCRPVTDADAHAAEPDCRHLQAALTQRTLLH